MIICLKYEVSMNIIVLESERSCRDCRSKLVTGNFLTMLTNFSCQLDGLLMSLRLLLNDCSRLRLWEHRWWGWGGSASFTRSISVRSLIDGNKWIRIAALLACEFCFRGPLQKALSHLQYCLHHWHINNLHHTCTYNRLPDDEPSSSI